MGHVDAGLDLELLGREMRHAGEAGGAEIDRAGLGLGERDQLLQVGGRETRDWTYGTIGARPSRLIGSKSFTASYGMVALSAGLVV